jgi:DNA (cytosine-5)-methyltransferase 1
MIKIATDCSGIEAPIQALKQMNIPFEQLWSCDVDLFVKKSIDANYTSKNYYNDIIKRLPKDLPDSDLDFYVCGFPCFIKGMKILTENGYKPIEKIKLNEKLLTHSGEFQRILNKQINLYSGDLYHIYIYSEEIICTKDHPFYIISKWNDGISLPQWKKANEITKNDYFGMILSNKINPHQNNDFFIYDKYVWFSQSKEIKITKCKNELVYNFEIENDNTYVVQNVITHNCQAFSNAGKKMYLNDPRSKIFFYCLQTIKYKNPKIFILENVSPLTTIHKGEFFNNVILKELNNIGIYHIYHKILNTSEYGIPQNRKRIYIIGIKKELDKNKSFQFPKKNHKKEYNLNEIMKYIELSNTKKECTTSKRVLNCIEKINKTEDIKNNLFFISLVNQSGYYKKNLCPALVTTITYWIYNHKYYRKLTSREMLNLQGFSKDFKQVVSNTQMKKQIGNSMSVNILKELFHLLLPLI